MKRELKTFFHHGVIVYLCVFFVFPAQLWAEAATRTQQEDDKKKDVVYGPVAPPNTPQLPKNKYSLPQIPNIDFDFEEKKVGDRESDRKSIIRSMWALRDLVNQRIPGVLRFYAADAHLYFGPIAHCRPFYKSHPIGTDAILAAVKMTQDTVAAFLKKHENTLGEQAYRILEKGEVRKPRPDTAVSPDSKNWCQVMYRDGGEVFDDSGRMPEKVSTSERLIRQTMGNLPPTPLSLIATKKEGELVTDMEVRNLLYLVIQARRWGNMLLEFEKKQNNLTSVPSLPAFGFGPVIGNELRRILGDRLEESQRAKQIAGALLVSAFSDSEPPRMDECPADFGTPGAQCLYDGKEGSERMADQDIALTLQTRDPESNRLAHGKYLNAMRKLGFKSLANEMIFVNSFLEEKYKLPEACVNAADMKTYVDSFKRNNQFGSRKQWLDNFAAAVNDLTQSFRKGQLSPPVPDPSRFPELYGEAQSLILRAFEEQEQIYKNKKDITPERNDVLTQAAADIKVQLARFPFEKRLNKFNPVTQQDYGSILADKLVAWSVMIQPGVEGMSDDDFKKHLNDAVLEMVRQNISYAMTDALEDYLASFLGATLDETTKKVTVSVFDPMDLLSIWNQKYRPQWVANLNRPKTKESLDDAAKTLTAQILTHPAMKNSRNEAEEIRNKIDQRLGDVSKNMMMASLADHPESRATSHLPEVGEEKNDFPVFEINPWLPEDYEHLKSGLQEHAFHQREKIIKELGYTDDYIRKQFAQVQYRKDGTKEAVLIQSKEQFANELITQMQDTLEADARKDPAFRSVIQVRALRPFEDWLLYKREAKEAYEKGRVALAEKLYDRYLLPTLEAEPTDPKELPGWKRHVEDLLETVTKRHILIHPPRFDWKPDLKAVMAAKNSAEAAEKLYVEFSEALGLPADMKGILRTKRIMISPAEFLKYCKANRNECEKFLLPLDPKHRDILLAFKQAQTENAIETQLKYVLPEFPAGLGKKHEIDWKKLSADQASIVASVQKDLAAIFLGSWVKDPKAADALKPTIEDLLKVVTKSWRDEKYKDAKEDVVLRAAMTAAKTWLKDNKILDGWNKNVTSAANDIQALLASTATVTEADKLDKKVFTAYKFMLGREFVRLYKDTTAAMLKWRENTLVGLHRKKALTEALTPNFADFRVSVSDYIRVLSVPHRDPQIEIDYLLDQINALDHHANRMKEKKRLDARLKQKIGEDAKTLDQLLSRARNRLRAYQNLSRLIDNYLPKVGIAGNAKKALKSVSFNPLWNAYYEDQFLNTTTGARGQKMPMTPRKVLKDLNLIANGTLGVKALTWVDAKEFVERLEKYLQAAQQPNSGFEELYRKTLVEEFQLLRKDVPALEKALKDDAAHPELSGRIERLRNLWAFGKTTVTVEDYLLTIQFGMIPNVLQWIGPPPIKTVFDGWGKEITELKKALEDKEKPVRPERDFVVRYGKLVDSVSFLLFRKGSLFGPMVLDKKDGTQEAIWFTAAPYPLVPKAPPEKKDDKDKKEDTAKKPAVSKAVATLALDRLAAKIRKRRALELHRELPFLFETDVPQRRKHIQHLSLEKREEFFHLLKEDLHERLTRAEDFSTYYLPVNNDPIPKVLKKFGVTRRDQEEAIEAAFWSVLGYYGVKRDYFDPAYWMPPKVEKKKERPEPPGPDVKPADQKDQAKAEKKEVPSKKDGAATPVEKKPEPAKDPAPKVGLKKAVKKAQKNVALAKPAEKKDPQDKEPAKSAADDKKNEKSDEAPKKTEAKTETKTNAPTKKADTTTRPRTAPRRTVTVPRFSMSLPLNRGDLDKKGWNSETPFDLFKPGTKKRDYEQWSKDIFALLALWRTMRFDPKWVVNANTLPQGYQPLVFAIFDTYYLALATELKDLPNSPPSWSTARILFAQMNTSAQIRIIDDIQTSLVKETLRLKKEAEETLDKLVKSREALGLPTDDIEDIVIKPFKESFESIRPTTYHEEFLLFYANNFLDTRPRFEIFTTRDWSVHFEQRMSDNLPTHTKRNNRFEFTWFPGGIELNDAVAFNSWAKHVAKQDGVDEFFKKQKPSRYQKRIWDLYPSMEAFLASDHYKDLLQLIAQFDLNAGFDGNLPNTYPYFLAVLNWKINHYASIPVKGPDENFGWRFVKDKRVLFRGPGGQYRPLSPSQESGYLKMIARHMDLNIKDFRGWYQMTNKAKLAVHRQIGTSKKMALVGLGDKRFYSTNVEAHYTDNPHWGPNYLARFMPVLSPQRLGKRPAKDFETYREILKKPSTYVRYQVNTEDAMEERNLYQQLASLEGRILGVGDIMNGSKLKRDGFAERKGDWASYTFGGNHRLEEGLLNRMANKAKVLVPNRTQKEAKTLLQTIIAKRERNVDFYNRTIELIVKYPGEEMRLVNFFRGNSPLLNLGWFISDDGREDLEQMLHSYANTTGYKGSIKKFSSMKRKDWIPYSLWKASEILEADLYGDDVATAELDLPSQKRKATETEKLMQFVDAEILREVQRFEYTRAVNKVGDNIYDKMEKLCSLEVVNARTDEEFKEIKKVIKDSEVLFYENLGKFINEFLPEGDQNDTFRKLLEIRIEKEEWRKTLDYIGYGVDIVIFSMLFGLLFGRAPGSSWVAQTSIGRGSSLAFNMFVGLWFSWELVDEFNEDYWAGPRRVSFLASIRDSQIQGILPLMSDEQALTLDSAERHVLDRQRSMLNWGLRLWISTITLQMLSLGARFTIGATTQLLLSFNRTGALITSLRMNAALKRLGLAGRQFNAEGHLDDAVKIIQEAHATKLEGILKSVKGAKETFELTPRMARTLEKEINAQLKGFAKQLHLDPRTLAPLGPVPAWKQTLRNQSRTVIEDIQVLRAQIRDHKVITRNDLVRLFGGKQSKWFYDVGHPVNRHFNHLLILTGFTPGMYRMFHGVRNLIPFVPKSSLHHITKLQRLTEAETTVHNLLTYRHGAKAMGNATNWKHLKEASTKYASEIEIIHAYRTEQFNTEMRELKKRYKGFLSRKNPWGEFKAEKKKLFEKHKIGRSSQDEVLDAMTNPTHPLHKHFAKKGTALEVMAQTESEVAMLERLSAAEVKAAEADEAVAKTAEAYQELFAVGGLYGDEQIYVSSLGATAAALPSS